MGRYDILTGRATPNPVLDLYDDLESAPPLIRHSVPDPYDVENLYEFILSSLEEMYRRLRDPATGPVYASIENRDLEQYKKEHATLKFSLPRRMGNTTVAIRLFEQYENYSGIRGTHGSLLVIPTMSYLRGIQNHFTVPYNSRMIVTPQMRDIRGRETSIVIVDTASYLKPGQLENIYNIRADFYVLLG